MEQGIRLGFVKTPEFRGGGVEPPKSPLGMPLLFLRVIYAMQKKFDCRKEE
jgi:hypothetical protein